ncbi:MAG TPA: TIGR02270 family protein, partial [Planctomycetota bacterium]|nr:TIGR02270 family protein [Planctomycetota bacterium]
MTIPAIVSQHAEETAFLWSLRTGAVHRPHFALRHLTDLDRRLEAHVDGLRIAGDDGWKICQEVVPPEDAAAIFALASAAFASEKDDRLNDVVAAASADPTWERGLASAVAWLAPAFSAKTIGKLLAAPDPLRRRAAITACALIRLDPGRALIDAAGAADPLLAARALRALGELAKTEHLGFLQRHFDDKNPELRFWASWSAALLSTDPNAVARLKEIGAQTGPRRSRAADLAVRRMAPAEASAWREKIAADPKHHRFAVTLAGVIGDPAAVPWLLALMKEPLLARGAGEAFSFITGIDLETEKLDAKKPEGFESGPTDNPEDPEVAMDEDDDLPWPDPVKVVGRWNSIKGSLTPAKRYLLG